ncbi:hypothetical protein [Roseibium sp.]|uniref:hypothetical protein n=1 Tax=Roseibium sp. TaxID=1936156 RepID=UPI0032984656
MQGMTHEIETTLVSKEINFAAIHDGLSKRSVPITQLRAEKRQRFHHVIVDCLQSDSQLGVNLPVGLLLEPVHRENPGCPFGQASQKLFENAGSFLCMYPLFLFGVAACIAFFVQWLRPDPTVPSARGVDEQISRDPMKEASRIAELGQLGAVRSAKEHFLYQVPRLLIADLTGEIGKQGPSLFPIKYLECGSARASRLTRWCSSFRDSRGKRRGGPASGRNIGHASNWVACTPASSST